jgi:methylated-DNA-[protein]-cysteine S-methyltransferase
MAHDAAGPAVAHSGVVVARRTLASPWGPVLIMATLQGVLAVELRGSPGALRRRLGQRLGAAPDLVDGSTGGRIERTLEHAIVLLRRTLAGESTDLPGVPLDWTGVGAWDRRVLEGARTIDRGAVTSYGRLARRIGAPGAARAVGAALGRNPFWLLVPCHRVIAGDGSIGGYGAEPDGLAIKRDLLAAEGIALPVTRLVD